MAAVAEAPAFVREGGLDFEQEPEPAVAPAAPKPTELDAGTLPSPEVVSAQLVTDLVGSGDLTDALEVSAHGALG